MTSPLPVKRPKEMCVDCFERWFKGTTDFVFPRRLRPAPHPGPRCETDHRARKKAVRQQRAGTRVQRVYGITLAEKQKVIDFQGGGCICAPWTGYRGQSRSLSVDHDHKTGMVRGVLCKHCNDLLGRVRDDPAYFDLMMNYLENPPAKQVLGERYVPE